MYNLGDKLYIVVRADLPIGAQMAQSCHALRQFTEEHPEHDKSWFKNSNYIAVLHAEDENHLNKLIITCVKKEILFSVFEEPFFDNQITAIAVQPGSYGRKICSSLPIAFRELS